MSDRGTQYTSFIEAELKAEVDRRESVNSRASTALTSSAGIVTLVLTVFAVLIHKDFTLSGPAKWFLVVALFAFLCSAITAVLAGIPWYTKVTKPSTLAAMINTRWADSESTARNNTAYANAVVIESLRRGTDIKFWFLIAAGACQIIAIAALAGCTLVIVNR